MAERRIGTHPGAFQPCIRGGAPRHQFAPPHHPCQVLQRRANEAVALCVNCQDLEPARDPSATKQLPPFGTQEIDTAAYPTEIAAGRLECKAQVTPQSQVDRPGENLSRKVSNFVRVFLGFHPLGP